MYIRIKKIEEIMAELKAPVMGEPSGRIENIVYRKRYGKVIAYARPTNQKISKSRKAVKARNNFGTMSSFAAAVNSVLRLREVWAKAKLPGTSAYHKVIRYNAEFVREGLLTTANKITPEGLPLQLNSARIENKTLSLSFEFYRSSGFTFPAILYIHLYFENASGEMVSLFKEISAPEPDGNYNLEMSLDSRTKKLFSKDPKPFVYTALAGSTSVRKGVYWTSTSAVQVQGQ